ncbi:hypothetical protein RF11_12976 [Thelohanellus kitauei]|uniref:Uncharacterized protein n=1 Tax=Thelohanellus kitauei TaxID=669202 RepID=A0A0C2N796_THEKT|nr:hypothetical protein RF11_12976 [Thelohanellus kitauei]
MDDRSHSIRALSGAFRSMALEVNPSKLAVSRPSLRGFLPSNLTFPLVNAYQPYKYLGVTEVARPLHGLNAEECSVKLFGIAIKILDKGKLNAWNTVRAINCFAHSHLWFMFPIRQFCPTSEEGNKKKLTALLLNRFHLADGQSYSRLLLTVCLDGLGLTDPSCVLH